jgi:hypothetical protein
MPQQASLIAIVIAMAIGIPIFLLVAAVLLRAGVSLYNRLMGGPQSPKAVPEPSFNRSLLIVLVVGVINALIGLATGIGKDFAAKVSALNITITEGMMMLGSAVSGILIMAVALKFLLPTRFGRAVGVSLCHLTVCIATTAVIVGLGMSLGAALAATM